MMKKMGCMFVVLIMTLLVTACTNKEYEEAMEKGESAVMEEEYKEATIYFEKALDEKEDDETAYTYLKQTETFMSATEAFEDNIKESKELFSEVTDEEDGLPELVDRAKEELELIEGMEVTHEDMEITLAEANEKSNEGKLDEALTLIESMEEEDLSHNHFSSLTKDMETLKGEIKTLKKTKKEAGEALEKAKSLEKEKKYEEGIEVINHVLKKDFEHDSLQTLKKNLDTQKEKINKAHEKQVAAEEAKEKEAAMIQNIYGYWTNYRTDENRSVGVQVMKFTETEYIWAITQSGSMDYAEISLTEADLEDKIVQGQASDAEFFTIDVIKEGEIKIGDVTYRKVSKDEMKEVIGGDEYVDEFFELVKEGA
ncbi:MAG TPA: hypothetical protein H9895_07855 [Candidatus Pseudogracilibacillus intestinigallinarum]|uniref:Uncharacterized protein n=1 Tax=Candidatus Pseudogracilibacillus intestinigallinarum TaxID=2838742 RepID=A0A9D1PMZ8_9BACI|nr:hypothetical protein [Candidatus Pseudogracilibacillus intestinigallinarum]